MIIEFILIGIFWTLTWYVVYLSSRTFRKFLKYHYIKIYEDDIKNNKKELDKATEKVWEEFSL